MQQVPPTVTGRVLHIAEVQPADLDEPVAVFGDWNAEFSGDLLFGWRPLQLLLRRCYRCFDLFEFFTLLARRPIQAAEAVQDRAANLVFGICLELDVVLGIVGALVGGFIAQLVGFAGISGFNLYSLLIAVGGAVLVLVLYHAATSRRIA